MIDGTTPMSSTAPSRSRHEPRNHVGLGRAVVASGPDTVTGSRELEKTVPVCRRPGHPVSPTPVLRLRRSLSRHEESGTLQRSLSTPAMLGERHEGISVQASGSTSALTLSGGLVEWPSRGSLALPDVFKHECTVTVYSCLERLVPSVCAASATVCRTAPEARRRAVGDSVFPSSNLMVLIRAAGGASESARQAKTSGRDKAHQIRVATASAPAASSARNQA
jgi:hypothetical protein